MQINDTIEIIESDEVVAELSGRATSRSVSKVRNRADVIRVSFDLENLREYVKPLGLTIWDIFKVGVSEIRIRWNDLSITAGKIISAKPKMGDDGKIDIIAVGWLDLLGSRYTGASKIFTGIDAGKIACTLIDESQALANGNLGIIRNTIEPSVNRDRTYEYKNIKEAIIELSEVENGFDFEFTWDKKFNVYYPRIGSVRDDIVFYYPGNIKEISFERDATKIINKIVGLGNNVTSSAQDINSQTAFGLKEDIQKYTSIIDVDSLNENINSELEAKKDFFEIPDLTLSVDVEPNFGSYNIGDTVRIAVDDNEILEPITGYWKIEAIDMSIGQDNQGDIRLRLMK